MIIKHDNMYCIPYWDKNELNLMAIDGRIIPTNIRTIDPDTIVKIKSGENEIWLEKMSFEEYKLLQRCGIRKTFIKVISNGVVYNLWNNSLHTTLSQAKQWVSNHSNMKYYCQYRINEDGKEYRTFDADDAIKHCHCLKPLKINNAIDKGDECAISYLFNDNKSYGSFRIICYDDKVIKYNSDIINIYGTLNLTSEQYFNELCGREVTTGSNSRKQSLGEGCYKIKSTPDYDHKSFSFVYRR